MKSLGRDEPLTLTCEWDQCVDVFNQMSAYLRHITEHLRDSMPEGDAHDPLQCLWRECHHDTFPGFVELVRHVYFHAFHVRIKSLGMSLIVKNGLGGCLLDASSRNTVPDLPERLMCGWAYCEGVFDNPDQFYSHVNNHVDCYPSGNDVPGGAVCKWDGCDASFKSKHKLREHTRSHTQEKALACPTCGGLFCSASRLYDHLKRQVEADVHSFQCSHCNKRCATIRLLKEHMRHHVNSYKCPFCDMTCPNPSALRTHLRYRHTEDRPFRCTHTNCTFAGKTSTDLRRHLDSHSAVWLQCSYSGCDFRSKTMANLNSHFRRFHQYGESLGYRCHICSQTYTRGTTLTVHLKDNHSFKWPPGHCRFKYKLHSDGCYRLQTVRYESIELNEQMAQGSTPSHAGGTPSHAGTPSRGPLMPTGAPSEADSEDLRSDCGLRIHEQSFCEMSITSVAGSGHEMEEDYDSDTDGDPCTPTAASMTTLSPFLQVSMATDTQPQVDASCLAGDLAVPGLEVEVEGSEFTEMGLKPQPTPTGKRTRGKDKKTRQSKSKMGTKNVALSLPKTGKDEVNEDGGSVDYCYNLDLLGQVALAYPASEDQPTTTGAAAVDVNAGSKKRKRPAKKRSPKKRFGKRRRKIQPRIQEEKVEEEDVWKTEVEEEGTEQGVTMVTYVGGILGTAHYLDDIAQQPTAMETPAGSAAEQFAMMQQPYSPDDHHHGNERSDEEGESVMGRYQIQSSHQVMGGGSHGDMEMDSGGMVTVDGSTGLVIQSGVDNIMVMAETPMQGAGGDHIMTCVDPQNPSVYQQDTGYHDNMPEGVCVSIPSPKHCGMSDEHNLLNLIDPDIHSVAMRPDVTPCLPEIQDNSQDSLAQTAAAMGITIVAGGQASP